jgi:vacuolar-type H+-ATPase subunit H
VEKLEKILHAEDAARAAVDEARDTTLRTLSEARAKAADVLRSGREETGSLAAARYDEILAVAERERAAFAESAATRAADELKVAEKRADDALAAVLRVLKER